MKYIYACCLFISLLSLTCACQNQTVYSHYQAVGNPWNTQDTLCFTLPKDSAARTYQLAIGVRHSQTYRYQDLWLAVCHQSGQLTDTLHLYLSDEEGNWKGTGKTYIQFTTPYKTLTLEKGDSIFRITHLMRENPLEGITDIGIHLLSTSGRINTEKDKE